MAISAEKIELISFQVIRTLHGRFEKFPEDSSGIRNAPFHMAFIKAFQDKLEDHITDIPIFITLSSWFHGLNTSLGQSFFENVAHILCDGTKRMFKGNLISRQQQNAISDIITNLNNGNEVPNINSENALIYQNNSFLDIESENFTSDCYFEDESKIVALELKTVRPNKGIFKNEKAKMLSAKTCLKNINPDKEIFYYLAFPFDPISSTPTGSDKSTFMDYSINFTKFFSPEEILLADEFWNFLSGDQNTMNQIIDIINIIATPEFMEKYEFLNDSLNKTQNKVQFAQLLEDWNLFSEIKLFKNESILVEKIANNNSLIRKFNQPIFKEGEYNKDRFYKLIQLFNE